ncbi:MAG TPA: hypothetical protein VFQ19_07940 [Nocardioidaceae bacterium]|nr:hypothetical protein [Nocardioidaceae bacterium]
MGGFDVVFFAGEAERLALDLSSAGWGLDYVGKVVAHHYPPTPAGIIAGRSGSRGTGSSPRCFAGRGQWWRTPV